MVSKANGEGDDISDASALIVGCGSIGARHARNLADLGVDVSVFDIDEERRDELATELDGATYSSLDAALESKPDTAFITTPSDHHVAPALEAANAGCHLFVEKPLSNGADGVDELLATIREKNLVTMVGSNFRFHPAITTIHELLERDRIGEVTSARIEGGSYLPDWHPDEDYRQMYSAKEGVGGALLDYIHEIDYARWLFGEVAEVSAMFGSTSSLDIETEDTASLISRFEDDVLCEFHLDYVQRSYSRSCHVIGEDGTIRWEWDSGCVRYYDSTAETWVETGDWSDEWETNRMYVDEVLHFLDRVAQGDETRTPLTEGWEDLRVALAAKESAESGRHVSL